MSYERVKTLLLGRLARFTAPGVTLTAAVLAEVQAAQERLEQSNVLFEFLKKRTTWTLSSGTGLYTKPDDFIRFLPEESEPMILVESNIRSRLRQKLMRDALTEGWNDWSVTGVPAFYMDDVDSFRFYPTTDKAYTLEVRYYAKDTLITEGASNKWSTKGLELLVSEAGVVLAQNYLKNLEAVQMFEAMRQRVVDQLLKQAVAAEMANLEGVE